MPPSKRLGSDSNSNVMVYMSGHGGDDFLKFQDNQEMMGAVRDPEHSVFFKSVGVYVVACARGLFLKLSRPTHLMIPMIASFLLVAMYGWTMCVHA